MSATRRPLPEVIIHRRRNLATLYVSHEGRREEFDFEHLPELPPMLLEKFDADVVGEILRQCRKQAEGVA